MILLYWMMYGSFREVRCPRVVSGDAAKHLFGILAVRGAGFSGCVGAPQSTGCVEQLSQMNRMLLASNTLVDLFAMN